jgi:uncharacterized protein YjiK
MLMAAVQSCAQDSLSLNLLSSNLITDLVDNGEYSGITYLGGTHYAVVHDKLGGGGIVFFDLHFRDDGTLAYANKTVPPGTEGTGKDSEGIVYVPSTRTLFVSAEADQSIREYDLKGHPTGRKLNIPADLGIDRITPNQGFEALAYSDQTHLFWTVTEGPVRTDSLRFLRLQSFGEDLEPVSRYLYEMDAPEASAEGTEAYVHGVSALTALPDGRLLVLEREVYVPAGGIAEKLGGAFTTAKIFVVRPVAGKDGALRKRLVTGFRTTALSSFANYEGMCLGPVLGDGRRTLLLIPDSQNGSGGLTQEYLRVYAIK